MTVIAAEKVVGRVATRDGSDDGNDHCRRVGASIVAIPKAQ